MSASLVVKVFADIDNFEKNLPKTERTFLKVVGRMEEAGKQLSLKVTLPLVALGAASVKMASDAEESASKMDAVFGRSTKQMNAWITQVQSTIPATRKELQDMTSGIQDLLVPLGMAPAAAQQMTQRIAVLSADLASFNNIPAPEALERIRSGLVGQYEPLLKFGVALSAATVKQEALRLGLITGKQELDANSRAQAAFSLILKGTSAAHGDAARTAGSTANVMKFFRRDVEELAVSFGQILVPAITPAIKKLSELVRAGNDLPKGTKTAVVAIGAVAAAAGPAIVVVATLTEKVVYLKNALAALSGGSVMAALGKGAATLGLIGGLVVAPMLTIAHAVSMEGEAARKATTYTEQYAAALEKLTPAQLKARQAELGAGLGASGRAIGGLLTDRAALGAPGSAGFDGGKLTEINRKLGEWYAAQTAMYAQAQAIDALTQSRTGAGGAGGAGDGGGLKELEAQVKNVTAGIQLMKAGARPFVDMADQLGAAFSRVREEIERAGDHLTENAIAARRLLGDLKEAVGGGPTRAIGPDERFEAAAHRYAMSRGMRTGSLAISTPLPSIDIPKLSPIPEKLERVGEAMKQGFAQVSIAIGDTLATRLAAQFGGGGTGSQIGASLGNSFGGALGAGLLTQGALTAAKTNVLAAAGNALLPIAGGIIGTIAGSLIGGLFGHKKKVDESARSLSRLAQTTERVNAAIIGMADGFKVEKYRFAATQGQQLDPYDTGSRRPGRGPVTVRIDSLSLPGVTDAAAFVREIAQLSESTAARGGAVAGAF